MKDLVVRQIQAALELQVVAPEVSGEKVGDTDRLAFSEAPEFCDGAGSCCAEVKDREAVGRVEPSTVQPRSFATAGIERRCLLAPRRAGEGPEWSGSEVDWINQGGSVRP